MQAKKNFTNHKVMQFGWMGVGLLLVLMAVGCQVSEAINFPTATSTSTMGSLQVYASQTPTALKTERPAAASATPIPLPSATPFLYQVKLEDSMLGIAFRFGVTLQALKEANPEVNPNIMSVGQMLVIPIDPEAAAQAGDGEADEPLDIRLGEVVCYPAEGDGRWCLVVIQNRSEQAAANVQIGFSEPVTSQAATTSELNVSPALDRIPAGASLPVAVFLPGGGAEAGNTVTARLLAAQPGPLEDPRYWQAEMLNEIIQVSADGRSALISGEVQAAGPVRRFWVTAAGYRAGIPVGLRRWEIEIECEATPETTPQPCGPAAFAFSLYSLGPEIEQVVLFVEALAKD